jgi:uncharacterized protein (DUF1778 family)
MVSDTEALERERISARVPKDVRERLEEAAGRTGATLNQFLVQAAVEKANQVLERERVTRLSARDAEWLLSARARIDTDQLPSTRRLPRRLPCVLLGRLAVDRNAQGGGLGQLMLADAIARTRATIEEAAGIGLIVDALHERAARFYCAFGFQAFKDDPLRPFLRIDWP